MGNDLDRFHLEKGQEEVTAEVPKIKQMTNVRIFILHELRSLR